MEHESIYILTIAVDSDKRGWRLTLDRIVNMVGATLRLECVYFKEPFRGRVTLVPTAHLWQLQDDVPNVVAE